jgi:Uncharacterized alpha/beta hydrolase domain (DUF2235)
MMIAILLIDRLLLGEAQRSKPEAIEQIWMPGVHSDIGGNADGIFLSDVALLTMIERTKHYCKELIWDDGYIARCEDHWVRMCQSPYRTNDPIGKENSR